MYKWPIRFITIECIFQIWNCQITFWLNLKNDSNMWGKSSIDTQELIKKNCSLLDTYWKGNRIGMCFEHLHTKILIVCKSWMISNEWWSSKPKPGSAQYTITYQLHFTTFLPLSLSSTHTCFQYTFYDGFLLYKRSIQMSYIWKIMICIISICCYVDFLLIY